MNWVQIVLLILKLLRDLQNSQSQEAFADSASANALVGGNGELLKWLWENREQVIEFVKQLFDLFSKGNDAPSILSSDELLK